MLVEPFRQSISYGKAHHTGPGFHWFGYYDKWQIDPTNRYVLGMRVDFEHRTPTADDVIKVGMIDLKRTTSGLNWEKAGHGAGNRAVCCNGIPGVTDEVIWNDRWGTTLYHTVMNVHTRKKRILNGLRAKPRCYLGSWTGLWPSAGYASGIWLQRVCPILQK